MEETINEEKKVIDINLELIPKFTNPVYLPYYKNAVRTLCLYGGYGSGKSYFAAQKLIYRILTQRGHRFLVCRKVGTSIRESVFKIVVETILKWGLSEFAVINKSDFRISFPMFDGEIIFFGLDDVTKLKSIQSVTSVWIEEAMEISEEDFIEIDLRLRGVTPHYKQTILSYNPIDPNHWIRDKFHDFAGPDVEVLHTTYLDNDFIDDEYKAKLEDFKTSNPKYYQTRCLGVWNERDNSNRFLYNFIRAEHVKNDLPFIAELPIILGFDFNINPITCVVAQRVSLVQLNVIKEYVLENSNIYELCFKIKCDFKDHYKIVTGDASGASSSAMVKGNTNYYRIIKEELGIKDSGFKVRTKNLDLINSRLLCNLAFELVNIQVDSSCEQLIKDCVKARIGEDGKLIKDSNKEGNHILDGFRYILDSQFPDLISKSKRYKSNKKLANAT